MVPGWAENRWKTHKLLDDLDAGGGIQTKDIGQAEVIITHSAGGHVVPQNLKAKLIVLIAPSYIPGRPFVISTVMEYLMDTIYYFRRALIYPWLLKNLYYIFFGIAHPLRTIRVYRKVQEPLNLEALKNYRVLLIRNKHDFFCSPQIADEARKYSNIEYKELAGRHDHCWIAPKPYVDLILKAYNLKGEQR